MALMSFVTGHTGSVVLIYAKLFVHLCHDNNNSNHNDNNN